MADSTAVVKAIWDRIHNWMKKKSPKMLEMLRPGVSKKKIKELERKLEINNLPEDFVASYRIHNGSTARYFFGALQANSFFSIDEIFKSWAEKKLEFEGRANLYFERTPMDHRQVRTINWSNKWIPFGREDSNIICIDLEPTKKGKYGQVIQWGPSETYTALRTPSFAKYLKDFANDLENGNYSLSEDEKSLVNVYCVEQPEDYERTLQDSTTDIHVLNLTSQNSSESEEPPEDNQKIPQTSTPGNPNLTSRKSSDEPSADYVQKATTTRKLIIEDEATVVKGIWDRIHKWMDENSPRMLSSLRPGVSEKQLKKFKEKLEIRYLPDDFAASYRIHNGSIATYFFGSIIANAFLSIEEIVAFWEEKKFDYCDYQDVYFERTEMDHDEVMTKHWSKRWIPFGSDNLQDLLCIDLEPTKEGEYGQVIQWHDRETYTALRASSFAEYLNNFATDLENGKYSMPENARFLVCTECEDPTRYQL